MPLSEETKRKRKEALDKVDPIVKYDKRGRPVRKSTMDRIRALAKETQHKAARLGGQSPRSQLNIIKARNTVGKKYAPRRRKQAARRAIREVENKIDELGPRAIEFIGELMEDDTVDSQLRLQAAVYLSDRKYGKPKQSVETRGGSVSVVHVISNAIEQAGEDQKRYLEEVSRFVDGVVAGESNGAGPVALPGEQVPGPGDGHHDPEVDDGESEVAPGDSGEG